MATAKVHKRKANHNVYREFKKLEDVGWLLRRYINGKPITTQMTNFYEMLKLDGYCEGT